MDEWLPRSGGRWQGQGLGVPPKGHKVSFGGDENFLKLTVMREVQLCKRKANGPHTLNV